MQAGESVNLWNRQSVWRIPLVRLLLLALQIYGEVSSPQPALAIAQSTQVEIETNE